MADPNQPVFDNRPYRKAELARLLGVTVRTISRSIKGRRPSLPRPFHVGRIPVWSGKALSAWFDRKSAEAML